MMTKFFVTLLLFAATAVRAQTVDLNIDNATMTEDGGTATVTAELSSTVGSDVVVNLVVSGEVDASDYSMATAITIEAGDLTGSTTITAVDDQVDEDDETMDIDIDSVTNATENGTQQVSTEIIDDDPTPTVTLTTSGSTVSEDTGLAQFIATASGLSEADIVVTLSFGGTATINTDYTVSSSTITIGAGNTVGGTTVIVSSDTENEDGETIIASISGVTNADEAGAQEQTITILDNDTTPTVTLSSSASSIAEDGGVSTITAQLSQVTANAVTVNLAVSGTATGGGTDYTLSSATINIAPGETTGTATVTAVADTGVDIGETVILDINTVTGASESGTQQVTITLLDDDVVEGGSGGVCGLHGPVDSLPILLLVALAGMQAMIRRCRRRRCSDVG